MNLHDGAFHPEGPIALLLLSVAILYLLPSIIAALRRHNAAAAIVALNILLGWTFLGWVGSFVWSLTGDVASKRVGLTVGQTSDRSSLPRRAAGIALLLFVIIVGIRAESRSDNPVEPKTATALPIVSDPPISRPQPIQRVSDTTPAIPAAPCAGQADKCAGVKPATKPTLATPAAPPASSSKLATIERDEKYREALQKLKDVAVDGSNWSYTWSKDTVTQKQIWDATVTSSNTISLDFPYNETQTATLEVRHHPQYGNNIIFEVDHGQILCSSFNGCSVMVHFDNQAAERYAAASAADGSTNYLFIKNYKRFIQKAIKAKTVILQIPFFQNGDIALEFNIVGLKVP